MIVLGYIYLYGEYRKNHRLVEESILNTRGLRAQGGKKARLIRNHLDNH